MTREVLRILRVTKEGCWPTAGRVRLRKCQRCSQEWAEVRLLPYEIPAKNFHLLAYDALLVEGGRSRSGAHYAEAYYGLPTRPHKGCREKFVLASGITFVPDDYLPQFGIATPLEHLASWTLDRPFGHTVAAIGRPRRLEEEPEEVLECGACYRRRAQEKPWRAQGHLYVTLDDRPRLNPHGEGVEVYDGRFSSGWTDPVEVRFFNHTIHISPNIVPGASAWVAVRRDLATVVARGCRILIESPDHPDFQVGWNSLAGEEVVLNMYHPFPRPERAVD